MQSLHAHRERLYVYSSKSLILPPAPHPPSPTPILLPMQKDLQDFPLVFDINLDYPSTMSRLQYLVDGYYIDNATDSIDVTLVTFNGEWFKEEGAWTVPA